MLQIHNSLTGRKEEFKPIHPGRVGLYVCGITVYDYCHVGHARFLVVFDLVQKWLRHRGYQVTYVRNITDIDDKIIRRAAEKGEPIDVLTEHFIRAMHEDCDAIGVARPDVEPRATQSLDDIIDMIRRLIERDHAYVGSDGDVFYSVASFAEYGRLSGKRLDDLRAGARVEVDEAKRDPADFVLWKRAKPGEPSWSSPWGAGRPGWHIECSAMSARSLGTHFDLHGGGMDLKFPHHENEIAQSCGANDGPFVNIWMHNGFLTIDDEKMSKSLGNFFTLREVLPHLRDGEVMRAFLLASHYRGPINYSQVQLEQADTALTRLYTALRGLDLPAQVAPTEEVLQHTQRFEAALDDDFNTPEAFAVLQGLAREVNAARDAGRMERAVELATTLRALGAHLGVLQRPAERWFRLAAVAGASGLLEESLIQQRIEARLTARRSKDFAGADRIRNELEAAGVLLEDQPGGKTIWRRK